MALSKSMSIGRFIFLMGILFLILVSICFSLLSVSLSGQFRSSGRLMDYTGAWNDIFVAMMEIGTSLDLMVVGDADGDDLASYEAASDSLSAAVERFLASYATDDESANVMRRLQSFNEYQRLLIEESDAPISFYLDRRYVDVGIERHTEEVLALYRSQMDTVLAQYADDMEHITRRILLSFLAVGAITAVISAVYLWFGMTIRNTIGRAVANLDAISQGTWDVPNLQGGRFEEFRRLFVGINRLKHRLAAYFRQLQDRAELERSLLDEKLKNETASRMLISAEMDMLRSQVNPHFLFNSLNILMDIIENDKNKAVEFTEALSDIYRYVLSTHRRARVTVSEEFSFLEAYIHILTLKYNQFLKVSILNQISSTKYIIPFTMQVLMENVTKHNIISDRHPMAVSITATDDGIVMQNPIRRKKNSGTGLGLKYIMTQYRTFGKSFTISDDGEYFTVKIPFI